MQLTGWDKAKITTIIPPAAFLAVKSYQNFYPKHDN
jgi:hypothetical protein